MKIEKKLLQGRRGIILIGLVLAALAGGYFQYGDSILNWYNGISSSVDFTRKAPVSENNPESKKIFESDFWKSLKMYGQLPIVPRQIGRANPFAPITGSANGPGARDAIRVSHFMSLVSALAEYHKEVNKYPKGESVEVGGDAARCLVPEGWIGEIACDTAKVKYMDPVPHDPGSNKYSYTSNGDSYTLKIDLETAKSVEYTVAAPKTQ